MDLFQQELGSPLQPMPAWEPGSPFAWEPGSPWKPVPGHLGISFAFGAFTVALACQKLLLLRCYFGHQEVISRMESSSRDALANTRLGLHFKWCKYLMPSEVKVTYGKLYARILQKISTMDLLYARTLVKKTLPWIGW